MDDPKAEFVRKRYALRKRIVFGEINIPLKAAISLVGPDCAYHLYSQRQDGSTKV